jgi:oligopeptide/dipeptide ABC transporter ATP-binding protein
MEIAPTRQLYSTPNHPYTRALLSAVPSPDPDQRHERVILKGDIPSPINPPSGCVFRTRCPLAIADCAKVVPQPVEIAPGHFSACIRTAPASGQVTAVAAA